MINLFEYQNKASFSNGYEGLEIFLDEIWQKRDINSFYLEENKEKIEVQRFIQFLHKTKEIKSTKYVGVIHYGGKKINLLPKIFFENNKEYSLQDVNAIQFHIIWWLSYCRKIKFPNYQTSMGSFKSDFFEVLIYMFAKYTRKLLSKTVYQKYEEIENELSFIKGRINTDTYIKENLSTGRWHKLNCTYDAFVIDNKFNRIIKYVTNLLFNVSGNFENKKYLREILFILDEVSDIRATAEECANIQFNPIFSEFETVRDYCILFLNNCIVMNYKNDLKLFAFLLPMEYVFEDFIFGFIDQEIEEIKAKSQISSKYLDTDKSFALRPDLLLKIDSKSIIADTKYKIIYSDEKDQKKGISQSDLYQMIAYGIRFKINDIVLFYPNSINNYQKSGVKIIIKDELADDENIKIKAHQIPIINMELFNDFDFSKTDLSMLFDNTKNELIKRIKEILF